MVLYIIMSFIFSSNGTNRTFQQLNSMIVNVPGPGDEPSYGILARTGGQTPEYSWKQDHFTLAIPFVSVYNVVQQGTLVYDDVVANQALGQCTFNWDPSRALEPGSTYLIQAKLRLFVERIDLLVQRVQRPSNDLLTEDDLQVILQNQYFIKVEIGSTPVIMELVYDSLNSFQIFNGTATVTITEQTVTPDIKVSTNLGYPFKVQLLNYSNDETEFKVNCLQFILMKLEIED